MLENSNLALKSKELSVDNLEESMQNLERINAELKIENQKLNTKLDTVKADRFRLTKFEAKASNLEKEIQVLRKENEELKQKDTILLAKTINIMETQRRKSTKIQENFLPKEELLEERLEVETEKSLIDVGKIEEPPKQVREFVPTNDSLDINIVTKPEDLNLKDEMQKEESVTRKKICPNCGNNNNAFIREFDDKTKIIYTYPRIYAKMYRCGQCGTEWR